MLPFKTTFYLGLFGLAVLGAAFYHPVIGIYAYLGTYNINPLGQWWGGYLPDWALRYSLILAVATTVGAFVQNPKIKVDTFLVKQEVFLLGFLLIIWLSLLVGQGHGVDYNLYKMTKVVFMILLASHVVTTYHRYEGMIWILVIAGLFLGFELYGGSGSKIGGRFHAGVGGSDFGESNFLAAHFGLVLPFAGIIFLKKSWIAKAVGLVSSVFMMNAIVMTRSRGAFVALGIGLTAALLFSSGLRDHRAKIVTLILIGLCGAFYLTDAGFWGRMETIQTENAVFDTTRDASAQGRLIAWKGAWTMAKDNPLGVGVGRFFALIGNYEPSIAGRDAHNTYLRCLAELGFQGFLVLVLLIGNAFLILRKIENSESALDEERKQAYHLHSFALKISLIVYLAAGMFITATYIEEFYWLLLMPVFLKRSLENEIEETEKPESLGVGKQVN